MKYKQKNNGEGFLDMMKYNHKTGPTHPELIQFRIYKSDIICLYKSHSNVYIVNKQGWMARVPYPIEFLERHLVI